jgi:hypothetical protein
MIPPDVTSSDLPQRTLVARVTSGHGRCVPAAGVIEIQPLGKQWRVIVTQDNLAKQPRGWLRAWALRLEEQGCVAPGEGMKLADRIAESVPLDPSTAFHLLFLDERQTGIVDIGLYSRLQVFSPYLRDRGLGLMADGPHTITGREYSLTITGKSTENLLGYESAVYKAQPGPAHLGYTIVPLYVDRHVDGKTERSPAPSTNYFRFSADAAFYRLIQKSWQTDFVPLMIAARTPAELEHLSKRLDADGTSANCEHLEMCIAIPREVAVLPLVSVFLNDAEMLVSRGTTVFQAIRKSGEQVPGNVLPHLSVYKIWNGQSTRVIFDPADQAILKLVLVGGETISWK